VKTSDGFVYNKFDESRGLKPDRIYSNRRLRKAHTEANSI